MYYVINVIQKIMFRWFYVTETQSNAPYKGDESEHGK